MYKYMMESKNFIRQNNNGGALLNSDNAALAAYKRQRTSMKAMNQIGERVEKLENTLEDIKTLLLQVLDKK